MKHWLLLQEDWDKLKPFVPKTPRPFRKARRKGGRPRLADQLCFEAALWMMCGGAWRALPKSHGSAKTVLARLREWERSGLLMRLWRRYLTNLNGPRRDRLQYFLRDGARRPKWEKPLVLVYNLEFSPAGRMALATIKWNKELDDFDYED